jgi:hypothetical protein
VRERLSEQQVRIIADWMLTILDDGIERYEDLHVDMIDPSWKPKAEWMNAALDAFRSAIELRDAHKVPFTVGLCVSFESKSYLAQNGRVSASVLQAQ